LDVAETLLTSTEAGESPSSFEIETSRTVVP